MLSFWQYYIGLINDVPALPNQLGAGVESQVCRAVSGHSHLRFKMNMNKNRLSAVGLYIELGFAHMHS